MRLLTCPNSAIRRSFGPQETLPLATLLSFLTVGLYQFLQTAPAQFGASPLFQVLRWLSDGLMALPLFAAAVWAGHWAASRLGLTLTSRADVFKRALLIAAALTLFLIPGWFAYKELASLTRSADLVYSHSHGAGGGITKYWVGSVVVYVLLLAPLYPLLQGGNRHSYGSTKPNDRQPLTRNQFIYLCPTQAQCFRHLWNTQ